MKPVLGLWEEYVLFQYVIVVTISKNVFQPNHHHYTFLLVQHKLIKTMPVLLALHQILSLQPALVIYLENRPGVWWSEAPPHLEPSCFHSLLEHVSFVINGPAFEKFKDSCLLTMLWCGHCGKLRNTQLSHAKP